jgi:hypothetical protein
LDDLEADDENIGAVDHAADLVQIHAVVVHGRALPGGVRDFRPGAGCGAQVYGRPQNGSISAA